MNTETIAKYIGISLYAILIASAGFGAIVSAWRGNASTFMLNAFICYAIYGAYKHDKKEWEEKK